MRPSAPTAAPVSPGRRSGTLGLGRSSASASLVWRVYAQQRLARAGTQRVRLQEGGRSPVPAAAALARRSAQPRASRRRHPLSPAELAALALTCCVAVAIVVVYAALLLYGPALRAIGVGVVAAESHTDVAPQLAPPVAGAVPTSPSVSPTSDRAALALPSPTPSRTPGPAPAPPTRLSIPKISLDVPVEPVGYREIDENGTTRLVWDTLPDVASFHQSSAYLGEQGNTVINGHRDMYSSIFRHLDKLQEGDLIEVYAGSVRYPYRVATVRVLPYVGATAAERAEHVRLMGPTYEARLTLITCTPVALATHRLYVIAEPAQR